MDTVGELERAASAIVEIQQLPGMPREARARLADPLKTIRDVVRHEAGQQREAIIERATRRFVEGWRP